MHNLCKVILLILCISVSVTSARYMICRTDQQLVNNHCWFSCLEKDTLILFKVSCHSDNWADFNSVVHFSKDMLMNRPVELEFYNCDFPHNFNLYNFTTTLGLTEINLVKISTPWSSFKNASSKFLVDSSVPRLDIEHSLIQVIPKDFLQSLDTWQLRVTKGPLNIIKKLDLVSVEDLLELDFSNNAITVIEPEAFDMLSHLHRLDLSHNSLTSLPSGIFAKLKSLTKVNLNSNSLRELSPDLFGVTNLREIYLNDNQLKSLPEKTFANLPNLVHVELKNNKLMSLSANLFEKAISLEWLLLDQNNLTDLPNGVFKDTSLKHLSLASNQLMSLNM